MKKFDNKIKEEFAIFGSLAAPIFTSMFLIVKKRAIFHKYQHIKVYFGIVVLSNIGFYLLINNPLVRYLYMNKFLKEYNFNINDIYGEFLYDFERSNKELTNQRYNLLHNHSDLFLNKQEFETKMKISGKFIDYQNLDKNTKKQSGSINLYSYLKICLLLWKYEKNLMKTSLSLTDNCITIFI